MNAMESLLAQLPPRSLFPDEMPRYPNLWFLVDPALALRGEYKNAVRMLVHALEGQIGLKDTFVQDVANHNLAHMLAVPGEGSDFQARLWPLEPCRQAGDPQRGHGHQVHARFYVTPLMRAGRTRAPYALPGLPGGSRELFAIPASVHYEVSTEDPLHPYEDSCPMCGITGEYAVPVDRSSQDYCVKIHDPLGVELLAHGTLRGQPAIDAEGGLVPCLENLEGPWTCAIEEASQGRGEPQRLACVLLLRR